MRYVTYKTENNEIISASGGPVESHQNTLPPDCAVADCGEFTIDGPLKNYAFVPGENSVGNPVAVGTVQRKPVEKWDMEAENSYRKMIDKSLKFHNLSYPSVNTIELSLGCVDVLRNLPNGTYAIPEDRERLNLSIEKKEFPPFSLMFEVQQGQLIGGSVPLGYAEIKLSIAAETKCVRVDVDRFLREHGEGFSPFLHNVIYASMVKTCLRLFNKLVDTYRLAFEDPEARPIGMADILSSAMTIVLSDGDRQSYAMGSPYRNEVMFASRREQSQTSMDDRVATMKNLLDSYPIPFIPSAIGNLKIANFYGQYRECIIWAATIISTEIENMLFASLPKDSEEYRNLKNKGKEVSGKSKRGAYFRRAFGKTLREYIGEIVSNYATGNQNEYWTNLPQKVEDAIGNRNLLLHRKKAITPQESDDAFYTCMNFIFAIKAGVPYSTIYSRDYSLKMLDHML